MQIIAISKLYSSERGKRWGGALKPGICTLLHLVAAEVNQRETENSMELFTSSNTIKMMCIEWPIL